MLWPVGDGSDAVFASVRDTLTETFGGVTAHSRSPADGLWKGPDNSVEADAIVVVEIMVETLDRPWWANFRQELERRLDQTEIVIRAHAIERL